MIVDALKKKKLKGSEKSVTDSIYIGTCKVK